MNDIKKMQLDDFIDLIKRAEIKQFFHQLKILSPKDKGYYYFNNEIQFDHYSGEIVVGIIGNQLITKDFSIIYTARCFFPLYNPEIAGIEDLKDPWAGEKVQAKVFDDDEELDDEHVKQILLDYTKISIFDVNDIE